MAATAFELFKVAKATITSVLQAELACRTKFSVELVGCRTDLCMFGSKQGFYAARLMASDPYGSTPGLLMDAAHYEYREHQPMPLCCIVIVLG